MRAQHRTPPLPYSCLHAKFVALQTRLPWTYRRQKLPLAPTMAPSVMFNVNPSRTEQRKRCALLRIAGRFFHAIVKGLHRHGDI